MHRRRLIPAQVSPESRSAVRYFMQRPALPVCRVYLLLRLSFQRGLRADPVIQ